MTDVTLEKTGRMMKALLHVVHALQIVSGVETRGAVNATSVRKAIVLPKIYSVKVVQNIVGYAPVDPLHAITATEDIIR